MISIRESGIDVLERASRSRLRIAMELLIAGVAVQRTGRLWEVYSHDGDHIGDMSTFMVCETSRALKASGLRPSSVTDVNAGQERTVTFGHDHHDPDSVGVMMRRRIRKFTVIH